MEMGKLRANSAIMSALLMTSIVLAMAAGTVDAQLVANYYKTMCPNAENVIASAINTAFNKDKTAIPGVLRIFFHDCFVHGCDASVLIDSPSEKDAIPNQTLRASGFNAIDAAKRAAEKACPGVVSCADILALAAQLSVKSASGGRITWKVLTGRRDGSVSSSSDVTLPAPTDSLATIKGIFSNVGLSKDQMVTLSGAHSIGVAHCSAIQNRLTTNDSTLDPTYLKTLKAECPSGSTNTVNLDLTTPTKLDEVYYKNLQDKKGLLSSDENLQNDATTQSLVAANTQFNTFGPKFASAMIAMGNINVLTGTSGNIRSNCRKFN